MATMIAPPPPPPFGDNNEKTIQAITNFLESSEGQGLLEETKRRIRRIQWRLILGSELPPLPEDIQGMATLIDQNLRERLK